MEAQSVDDVFDHPLDWCCFESSTVQQKVYTAPLVFAGLNPKVCYLVVGEVLRGSAAYRPKYPKSVVCRPTRLLADRAFADPIVCIATARRRPLQAGLRTRRTP